MAVLGLFTSIGITKTIDAANNEGFLIKPLSFGVSRNTGPLAASRTGANSGLWYQAAITERQVVDENTIKIISTVPQGVTALPDEIREIYIFGEDSNSNQFLLALGQPTEVIQYDPDGTVTIELQISLVDVDLTANYLFPSTFPVEISNHVNDPNAHPEYVEAMAKAGIFIPAGAYPFDFVGQDFEGNVEFDGTKATGASTGTVINFSSRLNGTEGNAVVLAFDGVSDVDTIVTNWNNANPNILVDHDGAGSEVLSIQNVSLSGGTYLVDDKDLVYRDDDEIYKRAIADGTERSKVVAIARRSQRCVVHRGLISYDTVSAGFVNQDALYLSANSLGKLSTDNNGIGIGTVIKDGLILFTGFSGSEDTNISQNFDAVVTNVSGLGLFAETQLAIDNVPTNSRILIDKLELVKETILTNGKTIEFVTNGVDKGWRKFDGEVASFRIDFGAVPTEGTWRIEWNGQESADLPFNATALDVENEFNLFSGQTGVSVTGDYSSGFVFTFLDEVSQPLPTFSDTGLNEIQRFNFSNIPDDGTITFNHEAVDTLNFPWDDNSADLEAALEALPSISDILVTGSFADQFFQFEFRGGVLVDGLQPQDEITAVMTDLDLGGVPTLVNGTVSTPISPVTVQQGKFPASNLRTGVNPITISVTQNTLGEPIGPLTAFQLDADNVMFRGGGKLIDFEVGIDVQSQKNLITELQFENVDIPIKSIDQRPGLEQDVSEVMGFAKDIFSQLRLTEHPTDKKRLKISTADVVLPTGTELVQELNSLLLDFEGAEIDFVTGLIYKNDGITSLGIDFTPVIPASQQFRWASVTIVPKQTSADQRLEGQVLVLFGDSDGATKDTANKAPFATGKPLGQVVLEGDLGLQEITRIITTRDDFGTLDGTFFTLYDDVGSVAFWIDIDDSGTVEPAHGAARSVEVTTINENDDPNVVASKLQAIVDADSKFSATVTTNRLIITDATIGPRTNATPDTSTFFVDILQEGRDTDATGLVDISNLAIRQLGVGSGSGGSGGGGPSFLQDLKFQLKDSGYEFLVASVFGTDQDAKVDSSTGVFSFPDSAWSLLTGQELVTINLVDNAYAALKQDIPNVDFVLKYLSSLTDNAPVVELSVDGGGNYETITMDRIGDTDTYTANHTFDDSGYAFSVLSEYSVANVDDVLILNQSTQQSISQEFTTSSEVSIARNFEVYLNKLGSPTGFYGIRIVADDAGSPSTDINDIAYQSEVRDIALLAAGDNTVSFEIPRTILETSTKYHIEFYTDDIYKSSGYNGTVDELRVNSDSSSGIDDAQVFNGTTYSAVAGTSLVYLIEGRVLDLRVKITASEDSLIDGFGIFYGDQDRIYPSTRYPVEYISFSGDVDQTIIPITQFNVNPDTLLLLDLDTGQVWSFGGFSFSGNSISVPTGTFDRPSETIRLKAIQVGGGTFSNDGNINQQLAENHVWSGDSSKDNSVVGRGNTYRDGSNNALEMALDENGLISFILKG